MGHIGEEISTLKLLYVLGQSVSRRDAKMLMKMPKTVQKRERKPKGRNNLLDAIRSLVGKLIAGWKITPGAISGFELSQSVDLPLFSGRV